MGPTSGGSSQPRVRTHISYVSCVGRQVLYHECHLGSPTNYTDIPKYDWMGSVTDLPPSFVNPKLRWIQYNISCGLRTTIMASPKPTSEKRASHFWVAVWRCSYSLTSTRKGLKITSTGDFPGVQWLRPCTPNAGDLSLIPSQETRSHMQQLSFCMLQPRLDCSVTKSCLTLCDPMDYSTPGLPVLH